MAKQSMGNVSLSRGVRCGRVIFVIVLAAALFVGSIESGFLAAILANDHAGIAEGILLTTWTWVTWGSATLYISDMIHSLWLKPTPLDEALRAEVWRDFIGGGLIAVCLIVVYAFAHRAFDPQSIDIAGLGLPFIVSSVLFSLQTYRRARAAKAARPYVALLLGLVCVSIVGGILHGLVTIARQDTGILHSIWLQATIVATSIVAFMITVYVNLAFEQGLTTVASDYTRDVIGVLRWR